MVIGVRATWFDDPYLFDKLFPGTNANVISQTEGLASINGSLTSDMDASSGGFYPKYDQSGGSNLKYGQGGGYNYKRRR